MKISIIGGSGFLGSHVADELTKRGHDIKIFDKKKSKWIKPQQKIIVGNILNIKTLVKAIKDSDIVFHFAALSSLDEALRKPLETVTNNILGTVNILQLCKKYNVKRIVYASSIYSTSKQGSFYRISKKASEDYIEEYFKRYGLNFTILRYGSLYGSRSNIENGVFRILKNAIDNKKIKFYGNKQMVRKYIHVQDAAKATSSIISSKYKNKYINITGNKKQKVTNLFSIIIDELKISKKIRYLNTINLTGHYTKSPRIFKLNKGTNYKFNKSTKFENGIVSLIKEIKKS